MSNAYVYPGSADAYVPSLSSDLVIEFSRNPDKFPLVQYCDFRIVEKPRGYYVKLRNDNQVRITSDTDNLWADAGDSPLITDGTDSFTFPAYDCVRRRVPKRIGHIALDTAGWALGDMAARLSAMNLMTKRVKRIHSTLTTSASWGANYNTATSLGGGTWANGTSTTPYIRKSITAALIAIEKGTLGVVQPGDLFMVLNPNLARVVATSQEWIDFIKQSPDARGSWEAQPQFRLYGLPEVVMGVRCIVDNTVYVSAAPSAATITDAFTLSDSYAVILTKQRAINPAASAAFSTFSPFVYEDMHVEIFDDPEHRRVNIYVTENIDDSVNALVAPQSGFLIKADS